MAQVISLSPDRLKTDLGTQVRSFLEQKAVKRYARLYRSGQDVDPLKAIFDGNDYILYDGFHRRLAAKSANQEYVKVEVTAGTVDLARWLACGANARHGVPMTQEDRRAAIRLALRSRPHDVTASWRSIAQQVGVTHHTVRSIAVSDYLSDNPSASDADVAAHFSALGFMLQESSVANVRTRLMSGQIDDDEDTESGQSTPDCPPVKLFTPASPEIGPEPIPDPEPEEKPRPEPRPDPDAERITLPPVPQKVPREKSVAPTPQPLRDCRGKEIPDELRDVFNDTTLRECVDTVSMWLDAIDVAVILRKLAERVRALPYLRVDDVSDHLTEAADQLNLAREAILAGLPSALCPTCSGSGCTHCADAGCVPTWRLGEIERGEA